MTSAAPPATNGPASLVPATRKRSAALPAKFTQSSYCARSAVQEAQLASPGATMSSVPPVSSKPDEDSALMLSLTQSLAKYRATAKLDCAYAWNWVDAPTEITLGSVSGELIVFAGPASSVGTTTVTPAATAASLNCWKASSELMSGNSEKPIDSLITFTVSAPSANTSRPTIAAPGATPSIRTLQADG